MIRYLKQLIIKIKNKNKIPDYIEIEPKAEDYGITEEDISNYYNQKGKYKRIPENFYLALLLPFVIITGIKGYLINGLWGAFIFSFLIGILGAFITGLILGLIYAKFTVKIPPIKDRIDEFDNAKIAYAYWIDRKKKDYWNNQDKETLIKSLCEIFKKQGYTSKLENVKECTYVTLKNGNGEVVLLQCNTDIHPTGMNAIKDFNHIIKEQKAKSGIVVSLSGFTQGVIKFSKEENIQLLGLDDLVNFLE